MKDFFDKYKEFAENRRRMGSIKLGFWVAFFGILLLIYYVPAGTSKKHTTNTNHNEPVEQTNKVDSFSFNYTINGTEYYGTYYQGSIELIGEDYSFYIIEDKVLTDKEDAVLPDYSFLDYNKVNEIIEASDLDATTKYKNGKEEYKYIGSYDDKEIIVSYLDNLDETISVHIEYNDNKIDIYYYKLNKTVLSFDEEKYIYELKEVEHEY